VVNFPSLGVMQTGTLYACIARCRHLFTISRIIGVVFLAFMVIPDRTCFVFTGVPPAVSNLPVPTHWDFVQRLITASELNIDLNKRKMGHSGINAHRCNLRADVFNAELLLRGNRASNSHPQFC